MDQIEVNNNQNQNWFSFQYQLTRCKLLKVNFVVSELIRILKKKYRMRHPSDIQTAKEKLAGLLNVDMILIDSLLGDNNFSNEDNEVQALIVTSKGISTSNIGLFIRFNPLFNRVEWDKQYDRIRKIALRNRKGAYPLLDKEVLTKSKIRNQEGYKDETRNIKTYLEVEKKIKKYWKKHNKGLLIDYENTGEKYTIPVFQGAIEDMVENKGLPTKENENLYRNTLIRIYYSVAKRYRLPTLTDLDKYLEYFRKTFHL